LDRCVWRACFPYTFHVPPVTLFLHITYRTLATLGLEGNQITGTIPRELAGMINIESFALESNRLNGTIPVEFGELSRLSSLTVHQNDLTGEMPLGLCPGSPDSSMTSLTADCDEISCDCCTDCCIGCFPLPSPSPTFLSTVPSSSPSFYESTSLPISPSAISDIPSSVPPVAPSSSPTPKCVASISTDKLCFGKEETIQVTFENCHPAASDWVAIRETKYASQLRIPFFKYYEALRLRPCGSQTCMDPVKSGSVTFDERLAVGGDTEYEWPLPKGKYKIYLIQDRFAYIESAEIQIDQKRCKEP
jgi:hypothetical protein